MKMKMPSTWRAQRFGRAYLDPSIRSFYLGRDGPRPPACQIYRYRYNRARTIRKHPGSLSYRQLAVLALLAGLTSPWRRLVLNAYATMVSVEVHSDTATPQQCLCRWGPFPRCMPPGGWAV